MSMLRLLKVAESTHAHRDFECMGTGLLILRVNLEAKNLSPYHWILEDGRKPGLDVAFSPVNGRMVYMKFFFQDERLRAESVEISVTELQGLPVFDASGWDEDHYYVFEPGTISPVLDGRNLYLIRSGYPSSVSVRTGESFSMLFTVDKTFSGAVFHDLNPEEVQSLKNADVL